MFPIRDHNPSSTRPVVTTALIAANIVVFLLFLPYGSNPEAIARVFENWALIPARTSAGYAWYTVFTSMFMHAGLLHIAGNMLVLWVFGDNLEDVLGHVGFLLFYLASGVAAALAQIWANPLSGVPMVGASGAIAGVMGGYLLLFPRARVDVLVIFIVFFTVVPVPAWMMLGFWFFLQLFSGVGADTLGGGVAYWAHAGGFVAGFLMMVPVWLRRGARAGWQQNAGRPPHPETRYRIVRSDIPKVRRRR